MNSGKIFADIFSRNKAATLLFTCGFFDHEFQVATFPYAISKMAKLWIDKDISSFDPDNIQNKKQSPVKVPGINIHILWMISYFWQ